MQMHLIKHHNYLEKPPTNQPTMPSSIAYKIEELEKELKQVNAKKEKLEKELIELKKDQQRVNRRRRNLPAELKVEIVDCLPVENAVHFLAKVPNRLIIHHCAPRVRRILKMIGQIVIGYARTLPATDSFGHNLFMNGQQYTSDMDIFLRYGAAYCPGFLILRGTSDGFVGYPANFFDDLIQHYYETKIPEKAVHRVGIELPLENSAPWPTALVQPQAKEMNVERKEVDNDGEYVIYILRNKHNPGIAFRLWIYFQRGGKCYQQMTGFFIMACGGCPIF